jgi:creatinine amidohydrolase
MLGRLACTVLMLYSCAAAQHGILLEDLTWVEAEKVLKPDTVVVIPLGAESKEHGPHLKLKNDFLMAQYLARAVIERADVVVAPTLNYGFYPAFLEYPGSTSLRLETSRDMIVDVCRSLAHYGPKRFYILNTGVSTVRALEPAKAMLQAEGIAMRFTDIIKVSEKAEQSVRQSEGGTHADEIETSMMLYIAPESVDMKKAVRDYHPGGNGGLSRDPKTQATYSASGVYGDATLATRAKGAVITNATIEGILKEIEDLRKTVTNR